MPRRSGTMTSMLALLATWILLPAAVPAAAVVEDEPRPVLAASGGRHVFVSMDGGDVTTGFEIMHFDGEAGPAAGRIVARVPRRPEAIAAFGDRCWLVLPPFDADKPQREVVSFKVARNPATNLWYAEPVGRFEVLPVLPREPRLVGMVGDTDGPVAIVLPSQRAARGIDREPGARPTPAGGVVPCPRRLIVSRAGRRRREASRPKPRPKIRPKRRPRIRPMATAIPSRTSTAAPPS